MRLHSHAKIRPTSKAFGYQFTFKAIADTVILSIRSHTFIIKNNVCKRYNEV